jgi:RNA polymerase sigma-70 factor, ECF subfamily
MMGNEPDRTESSLEPVSQGEFHRLFVQNQRRIFGHILTLLPRLADAEEVFRQSCVVILSKADQFLPGTDFVRWACQIAQYEVYNYRRRKSSERLRFDHALLEKIAARRLEKADRLEAEATALRGCVEKLSASDRRTIEERYRRKITLQALAVESGRSVNTVYKAVQRIRRALRQCVENAIARQNHTAALGGSRGRPQAATLAA